MDKRVEVNKIKAYNCYYSSSEPVTDEEDEL